MKRSLWQACSAICLATGLWFAASNLAADRRETVHFGRSLFHGFTPWSNADMATANGLPAEFSACARCHGPTGVGRSEAGIAVPSLTWSALLGSTDNAPGYSGRSAVLNAIEHGVGRGGRELNAAMPRFNLTDPEKRALLDYLQFLGSAGDRPPGVDENNIRIGALLPLQGQSAAIGAAVQKGLRQSIDKANERGGIYGRRLELIVYPTTLDSGSILAGLDHLLATEKVYTLVASFTDLDDADARQQLEQRLDDAHVADIAALSQPVHGFTGDGRWRAPLLPPIDEQFAKLAQALQQACPDSSGHWVLAPPDQDSPLSNFEALRFSDSEALMKNLRDTATDMSQPRTIMSTASSRDTRELANRLKEWHTQTSKANSPPMACIGYLPFKAGVLSEWPDGWTEALVSPIPRAVAVQARGQIDLWTLLGSWAGQILIEALAQAGPHLYERALLDALPALNGRELQAGVRLAFRREDLHGWEPTVTVVKPAAKSLSSISSARLMPVPANAAF